MTMNEQVMSLCQKAAYGLYKIGKIRRLLDQQTTEKLVHALLTSRLDYYISTLIGCSQEKIHRIQLLQNSTAKFLSRSSKYDHITPILRSLRWLPVAERVDFKVLLMIFKAIYGLAPDYVTSLIGVHTPGRFGLRSSSEAVRLDSKFLAVPRTKFYGGRAFDHVAPSLWNELPESVRSATTVTTFKSCLKTYLFKRHFS